LDEQGGGDPAAYFDAHVFVCINRRADGHPKGCCAARGSEDLLDYIKRRAKALGLPKIRVNSSGCLDRCEHGPVIVVYPAGIWYRIRNIEEADAFVQKHLAEHGRADELMLRG
jgi:(2Fe-2S) ferredoxin